MNTWLFWSTKLEQLKLQFLKLISSCMHNLNNKILGMF